MGSDSLTHCENCNEPLQGPYCHACGQPVANPVRHVGHAIEDVFESFWHLDGRVFRTLRHLLSPGRVALEYLAGHRMRYIAPLRLFVILSLITFFVGKLTVHAEGPAFEVKPGDTRFAQMDTVAEVESARDDALRKLVEAEREAAKTPGASPALVIARTQIEGAAAARIAELRGPASARPPGASPSVAKPEPAAAPPAPSGKQSGITIERDWDPEKDPVQIAWLPDFANRWLTDRAARAQRNMATMGTNQDALLQAFMGALPTALFVLVPVFALLLKVFYVGSRRLYLEHLAVALYSHAFMLLALLASFLLAAIGNAAAARASFVESMTTLGTVLLWCWVPIYLLLMQKRVYRQGWLATSAKYAVVGCVYVVLVSFAALYALLAGIVGM
ncbi:DUF3667 domain-containing protein [Lysobacter olei]